jgi:hypothetical protein
MAGGGRVASFIRWSMVCGLAALTFTGCTTIAERQAENARKRAAPTAVVVKSQNGRPVDNSLDHTADGYPTFNGPLTAANVQINDQQALDMRSKLTALGAAHKAGTITQAEYDRRVAEMKKLAASQQQTLQDIQN